jgi:hypothetical protein
MAMDSGNYPEGIMGPRRLDVKGGLEEAKMKNGMAAARAAFKF